MTSVVESAKPKAPLLRLVPCLAACDFRIIELRIPVAVTRTRINAIACATTKSVRRLQCCSLGYRSGGFVQAASL